MRTLIVCGVLALSVTAASAAEDIRSANYWLPRCKVLVAGDFKKMPDPPTPTMCLGMVIGIASVLGEDPRGYWCADIPAGVTPEQLVRVVVKAIESKPELMHRKFPYLAMMALRENWPC